MPMNILPVLLDGMWVQLQHGSELSEFSVTFPFLTVPSHRYPPHMGTVAKTLFMVLGLNTQRQGLDVIAVLLSTLQSVNVNTFWE